MEVCNAIDARALVVDKILQDEKLETKYNDIMSEILYEASMGNSQLRYLIESNDINYTELEIVFRYKGFNITSCSNTDSIIEMFISWDI